MTKNIKKWIAATVLLAIGTGAALTYYTYDSRTDEEIADYYTKEWAKVLNVNDEVVFNITLDKGEPRKLDSKYGTFLVKLKETRKYLDGYKITFSVGNLSTITLPKPKVKLKWYRSMKSYDLQDVLDMPKEYKIDWYKKIQKEDHDRTKSFKEKEFTNLKDLTGENWTDLEFFILPCDPEQFGQVEFSIVG